MFTLNKIKKLVRSSLVSEVSKSIDLGPLYLNSIARNSRDLSIEGIVFSMDRAIQLYGLLESYFDRVQNPVPLHIVYRATTAEHRRAYDEVFQLLDHLPIKPILQNEKIHFRPIILDLLNQLQTSRVFFLVDDILFIEPVDLQTLTSFDTRDFVPSLRLGNHLTRCYTMNMPQAVPRHEIIQIATDELLIWKWSNGSLDWGYPLSVDGHIFDRQEILYFLQNTDFTAPNTLEGHLQKHLEYFKNRWGVCYPKGRIVNIPWNKVQSENDNLHGTVHQNDLLDHWTKGFCIDVQSFYGVKNLSCHQEFELKLKKRTDHRSCS